MALSMEQRMSSFQVTESLFLLLMALFVIDLRRKTWKMDQRVSDIEQLIRKLTNSALGL